MVISLLLVMDLKYFGRVVPHHQFTIISFKRYEEVGVVTTNVLDVSECFESLVDYDV